MHGLALLGPGVGVGKGWGPVEINPNSPFEILVSKYQVWR